MQRILVVVRGFQHEKNFKEVLLLLQRGVRVFNDSFKAYLGCMGQSEGESCPERRKRLVRACMSQWNVLETLMSC